MKLKTRLSSLAAMAAVTAASLITSQAHLVHLGSFTTQTGGGEIQAYDAFNKILVGTKDGGVEFYNFANPAAPVLLGTNDVRSVFGTVSTLGSISSVATDPLGRNFGVATAIPTTNDIAPGKVIFYNLTNRTVLATVNVGYHPDMVTFTPDGSKILVANEGELIPNGGDGGFVQSTIDRPGSISVIDVSNIGTLFTPAPVLRITEAMSSSGNTADWFELSNLGTTPVDLAGYKVDDSSDSFATSAALVFGGFGGTTILQPGESAIFIEGVDTEVFRSSLGLPAGLKLGSYNGSGLGLSSGGDGLTVFNGAGTSMSKVAFGTATSGSSFYWLYDSTGAIKAGADGVVSAVADASGATTAANGNITSAGSHKSATVYANYAGTVTTRDFSGVDLSAARIDPINAATPYLDIEPEYISVTGNKAYVTLQENNAVGIFNLDTLQWEAIRPLGLIYQRVDASDKDGILIDDVIAGYPLPDEITSFTIGGITYFATANEGDTRGANSSTGRLADEVTGTGALTLEPVYKAQLDAFYQGLSLTGVNDAKALGRLRIPRYGNTNALGQVTNVTMFGTRSVTIFAADGTRVFDSGSDFETISAARIPTLFNSEENNAGTKDGRSDNKGPEPEGVAYGVVNGRNYVFVGMERSGGVFQYDVTNPTNAYFVDFIHTGTSGDKAPEGIVFVDAAQSPTGKALLLVGHEVSGSVAVFEVTTTPPTIVSQPQARTVGAGTTLSFDVTASGNGPFTYQWYSNNVALVYGTNATLVVTNAQAAATYKVTVTTPHDGAVTSSAAAVALNPSVVPVTSQFNGFQFHGLVGVGRLNANLMDTIQGAAQRDTLGGLFSSMYFDLRTYKKTGSAGNWTYSGVLYGLPDRGFGDGANPYRDRVQELYISITPAFGAGLNLPQDQIKITHQSGLLLQYDDNGTLKYFLGSDADDTTVTDHPATTFGGGHRSLDPEGLVVTTNGTFYISDEYGPFVYKFNASGLYQTTLKPTAALLPRTVLGSNFDSVTTKSTGRSNNRGMEGLTITPDSKRLIGMMQSPTVQDGGNNARHVRLFVFDIEAGSPTENQVIGEYIYTRPNGMASAATATAVSEIIAVNDHQFIVLDRDGRGLGEASTTAPFYKSLNLIDINGATNVKGMNIDKAVGDAGQQNLPANTDLTALGITSVAVRELVDMLRQEDLDKFGLNKYAGQSPLATTNTISEKWEGFALIPLDQTDHPDGYLLLVGNDNDLRAAQVYHNGLLLAENTGLRNDNTLLAYHVTLPGYQPVIATPPSPLPVLVQVPALIKNEVKASNLEISWPATAGGYVLQSADEASGPWQDVATGIVEADGRKALQLIPNGSQKFYRLIKAP